MSLGESTVRLVEACGEWVDVFKYLPESKLKAEFCKLDYSCHYYYKSSILWTRSLKTSESVSEYFSINL